MYLTNKCADVVLYGKPKVHTFDPAYTLEAWNFKNKTALSEQDYIGYINKLFGVPEESTDVVSTSLRF
jgi:hypothetical protein